MTELWAGERVARWLRQSEAFDRQFAPVSRLLFEAAGLRAGESVLDIGCGTGGTTRAARVAVGTAGAVTGLDVSAEMLAAARSAPGGEAVEWLAADVVGWAPQGQWDVVLSRFGVMFFSDPSVAFATLARAGRRLCLAVWSRRDACELFEVPLAAAASALPGRAVPPSDAGPFSLSDGPGVAALLDAAGWDDVTIAEHGLELELLGGSGVGEAAQGALDFGPVRTVTEGATGAELARVVAAIGDALAPFTGQDGVVRLGASISIITATSRRILTA